MEKEPPLPWFWRIRSYADRADPCRCFECMEVQMGEAEDRAFDRFRDEEIENDGGEQ